MTYITHSLNSVYTTYEYDYTKKALDNIMTTSGCDTFLSPRNNIR